MRTPCQAIACPPWQEKATVHPVITRKGKDRGTRSWILISWSCSHAACRLLCLQEEEDILCYHLQQKNESNVSAARQRGTTNAGANSATASGTSHEDGVEGRDKHQRGAEAGAASPKALATPLPFLGLERVCCIPKERWAQPRVGSDQLTGVLWKLQS